jgi:glycosyltransferase involved in cell wall biosynthesis
MLMCKGEFSVELTESAIFIASYVFSVIQNMVRDKFVEHAYISRLKGSNVFLPPQTHVKRVSQHESTLQPLVSVCIYNYNYGQYLRQCLESVITQTYENIEICFSDNASTDDSWTIALEYAARYPNKINLTRNRINYGPNVNLWNCVLNMRGKYLLKLCSDDAIRPKFIERCVSSLEQYSEAAFAMVHRDIMDESGLCISEAPFYEQSCLIPGNEQAAVYMMSSVNPSISQVFYNVAQTQGKRMAGNLNDRWFGDRIMDFHICCDSPIVYINEPLLLNRIHDKSESAQLDGNLLQCLGEYVLLHQLVDIAGNYPDMNKAKIRLPSAIEKLGRLCLRYCLRCLTQENEWAAKRYFHLSIAIFPAIESDGIFIELAHYWLKGREEKKDMLGKLIANSPEVLKRVGSYPVPQGSVLC